MELLDSLLKLMDSAEAKTLLIAGVVDFIFRLIKTPKPLSILHVVANVLHKVGSFAEKLASLMDKVLPQRVEEKPMELPKQ